VVGISATTAVGQDGHCSARWWRGCRHDRAGVRAEEGWKPELHADPATPHLRPLAPRYGAPSGDQAPEGGSSLRRVSRAPLRSNVHMGGVAVICSPGDISQPGREMFRSRKNFPGSW
jgi:hypothetical protein